MATRLSPAHGSAVQPEAGPLADASSFEPLRLPPRTATMLVARPLADPPLLRHATAVAPLPAVVSRIPRTASIAQPLAGPPRKLRPHARPSEEHGGDGSDAATRDDAGRGPPIDAADLPPLDRAVPLRPVAIGAPSRLGRPLDGDSAGDEPTTECRPYATRTAASGRENDAQGIVCRDGDGPWYVVIEAPPR